MSLKYLDLAQENIRVQEWDRVRVETLVTNLEVALVLVNALLLTHVIDKKRTSHL